jgi:hypothetical protein
MKIGEGISGEVRNKGEHRRRGIRRIGSRNRK